MSAEHFQRLGYRPDVDGLRAIAILSVLFFHLHRPMLPGGFVGVDIFFTISGFLITRNICAEIEARRFSLAEFYRRRIKRIAPAMLVVVLATLIVSQIVLLPEDGRDTARSAFWSLASAANIYFWLEQDAGCLAISSEQLPLLHLWSLGVEEQFYLIWPPVLLALYRAGRVVRLSVMLGVVAILSFWLGEAAFDRDPFFAITSSPSRAGELLLGAFVAFQSLRPNGVSLRRAPASVLAGAGTLLLLTPMFLLSETSRFPGWAAAPPTPGTALVILAGLGTGTPVSRVLGSRAMVWVGKLS